MELVDVPTPAPGPGQALVRLAVSGVNFIDVYHRSGAYKVDRPIMLGSEGADSSVQAQDVPGGSRGSKSPSASGSSGASGGIGGSAGGSLKVGALAVAVAAAVVFGLRRLLRRR